MIKLLGITLLLYVSLYARENPFFPSEGETDIPMSSNVMQNTKPLVRAALTLPSTARVIESFTVTYKNLDGSIEQKKVNLNNSIDWHLPLFLSQSYNSSPSQKIDVKTKNKNNNINKKDIHSSNIKTTNTFEKLETLKFISLYVGKREFKLVTKDKMIRDFLITKPHRIVCDFKRDIDMRSYVKKLKNYQIIKEFRVGNHKGYYRVVVELDGYYKYKIKKIKDGYVFKLI